MHRLARIVDPFVGGPGHPQIVCQYPGIGHAAEPVEVEVSGEIQLETVLVGDGRSRAEVCRALYERAEQMIAAVEADGWQHVDHPIINLEGDAYPATRRDPARFVSSCRIDLRLLAPESEAFVGSVGD